MARALALLVLSAAACSGGGGATSADGGTPLALLTVSSPSSPSSPRSFSTKLAALAWETRVHEQPSGASKVLGYLRAGGVVPASDEGTKGGGCRGEWHAVEPVGYVCVEPGTATLDLEDPLVHALARRPDLAERLPYMYATVRKKGPLYARLPTRAQAVAAEWHFAHHFRSWLRDPGEDGATFRADYWLRGKSDPSPSAMELWDAQTTREVPDWLADGKFPPGNVSGLRHKNDLIVNSTKDHNGFALLDTAVVDGRRYGITTDLLVFPIDRLRPIEGSAFHGYRIPEDIDFPFALVRRDGASAYMLRDDDTTLVRRRPVPRRAAVRLTGKQRVFKDVLYFETADGLWLSERYASRVEPVKRWTKWSADGERWVDVSIAKQVLVAYEGTKAVYATLVSTGEAGLGDPQTSKSTVLGEFRMFAKHLTTTMSSKVVGEEFELKDIPFVQYFEDGYALHAAYWHDDFGIPRSHGCVNLSPEDAKWLFLWTDPQLPPGWHGVRSAAGGSVVDIHP